MVAIVSGNSLGLGQTSLATLGQHGLVGTSQHGRNGQAAFVNVATGNLVVQNHDDHLVGAGADIASVRTYNSRGMTEDADNWVMSLARPPLLLTGTVNTAGSTLVRTAGDGATATYGFDEAAGKYVSYEGEGAYDQITFDGARYTWTDGSTAATEVYAGSAPLRLLQSLDAAGKGFSYHYDEGGRLKAAVAANGEETRYVHDGNLLTQVSTFDSAGRRTGTRVRYAYDAEQRLVKVTVDLSPADGAVADGRVYVTAYAYHGASKRVASITQDDGNKLAFSYDGPDDRLSKITDALGNVTTIAYGVADASGNTRTQVTDAQGLVTTYEVDAAGRLTRIVPPAGGPATAFAYDAKGNVASVTNGAGAVTTFGYDARGNRDMERDATGATIRRTFNDRNFVLTETVAGPGPQTTRHIYDASNKLLRFTVSAAGRVTEHAYEDGRRVSTKVYAAKFFLGPAFTETALARWAAEYGAASIQRTEMTYDARGQLSSRTSDGAVETFIHDRAGRLLTHVAAGGGATHYTYDGLGRVLSATDAAHRTTLTAYLDAEGRIEVRMANGLVSTQAYDAAGRLLAVASSAGSASLGTTRYAYDAAGRLRMTEDATGIRSWMLYDDAGRKVADVDGTGTLTEYAYDAAGRLARQRTYATAARTELLVTAGGLPALQVGLATVRPVESTADAVQWRAYDAAGRLVRQAVATGAGTAVAVTEFAYDGASRLVRSTAYAKLAAAPASVVADVALPEASADDRITRYFHDADGRRTGTLDAEGFLSVTVYDGAGLATEHVAYANAVGVELRAQATLEQMKPRQLSGADVRVLTFHDARGLAVAELDAESYLTRTVYDAAGNAVKTIRYAEKVTESAAAATALAGVVPPASAADRVTDRSYDALGRLVSETTPDGLQTTHAYDAAGNLVATVRAADASDKRSLLARYDVLGRLTGELTGAGAALVTAELEASALDAIWAAHGITHAYDAASRRTSTTDALGQRTLFFYNRDGALTHTVNALGEVREQRFDVQGRLKEQIAYAGRIAVADLQGGLVTGPLQARMMSLANEAADARTRYTYSAEGRVTSQASASGLETRYAYNAFGDQSASTVTGRATETYRVDRRGLRVSSALEASGSDPVSQAVYDAFGRMIESVDANGNRSSATFDRLGRQVATRNALGAERSSTYDAFGRVLTTQDATGKTTQYAYDPATRSITVTTPEGVASSSVRNAHGDLVRTVDGNLAATDHFYDSAGRLVRTVTPLATTSQVYDAAGRLTRSTDGNGVQVAYAYDAAGRVSSRTVDPAGLKLVTSYRYDGRGQRIEVTDPKGVRTTTEFSRDGQVLTQTVDDGGLNLQTTYAYDAAGRLLTVNSPGGTVTHYAYDTQGRRTQETVDPEGLNLQRSWTYDRNGNAVTSTDARGLVTRHAYDAADRLVYTVGPAGNVSFHDYDKEGRVVLAERYADAVDLPSKSDSPLSLQEIKARVSRDPAHDRVERRLLDDDGRVVATLDGAGSLVTFRYDGNGNVLRRVAYAEAISPGTAVSASAIAAAAGKVEDATRDQVQRNTYDAANRLVYSVDGTGAVTQRSYDANGNLVRLVAYADTISRKAEPSSVVKGTADRVTAMAYDAANRLVFQVDPTNAVTQQAFDANGQVIRHTAYANRIRPLGADAFSLATVRAAIDADTALDRVARHAYDAAGRRVFDIDAAGAMTQTRYDGNGNVTAITAYADLASTSRLSGNPSLEAMEAAVTADSSVDRTTRYAYDAAGRRVFEVDALGSVTQTQYDGVGNVVARTQYALAIGSAPKSAAAIAAAITKSSGDRRQAFSYNGAGHLVGSTDALGARESYTVDALGQRLAFVNKEGATWTYSYDAGGRQVKETSPQVAIYSVTYDSDKKVLELDPTDRDEIVTRLAYDALGNLTQRTEAAGRQEERTTRYEYDAAGRQVRAIFPKVGVYDPSEDDLTDNGDTGVARRREDLVQLETRTHYDAFGNAVANTDVGGGVSQKAYDVLGQLAYEVDALGYVTGYQRDAFGQVVRLVRHAEAIGIPKSIDAASDAASAAAIAKAVKDENNSRDRILLSTYDRAGRLVETQEPTVYVYQHGLDGEGRADTAGKTIRQVYNAFGELVQVATPRGIGDATSTTTHYYDRAGRQVATVDALGYLTRRTFDTAGNLLSSTEYATALEKGWTRTEYGAKPAATAADRRTEYTYDRLNRKTAETRVGVQFSAKSDGTSQTGDLTTSYWYDAVGNQTAVKDAAGAVTYTYYDALGRVRGVAAPKRDNAAGDPIKPLTTFRRDAHGKVLVTTEYAEGAESASLDDYETDSHRKDRQTFSAYDSLGRNVVTTDAAGHSQYFSYDRHGNLAKHWQAVEGDGKTRTVFQVNVHDKLGRVLQTITPASRWVYGGGEVKTITQEEAGLVKMTMTYNGFGEMTSKGLGSGAQERFDYDLAGRLWRTNAGDGVWRVNLFDLQGNVTSEIRSSGSGRADEDLGTLDDAAAADRLRYSRRTDMVYDALGRVTAREGARRREQQGGVTVDRQEVDVAFKSAKWLFDDERILRWTGENRIVLQWNNLAALGSGDVKVTVEYLSPETTTDIDPGEGSSMVTHSVTQGGVARKFTSEAITSHAGATGTTLEWKEEAREWYSGGIGEITRVIVYKKDVNGVWRAVVDQAPGYGGNVIDLAAPSNPDASIALELRKAGTKGDAGWFTVGTVDFGSGRRFDADALGPGSYDYRVQVKTPGEDWHVTSTGEIVLTSPKLNPISAGLAHGKPVAGVFSWKAPAPQYGQDFRYRLAGSTGLWRSLEIDTTKAGLQVVDTRGLDDGAYDFELLWSRTDHGVAVSHAVGSFTVGKKPTGSISGTPGKVAISTSEGGKITQDAELNGESRWLRPLVLQNVDRWGNVVAITDPRSTKWKTTYAYNANNQLVTQVAPNVTGDLGEATTRYYYDEVGRQVAVRDANNHVNGQVWDLGGNLVQELHADGGVVTHRYNAFGDKASTRDAEGHTVTYSYDDMGRMTSVNKGSANVYSVSSKDNETLKATRRDIVERWTYDELGQKTSHTNGNGETLTYSYDLRGNLVQTKQPLGQATRSAFDALGRKVAEVDAEGNYRTWKYDYFGVLKSHKDLGGGDFTYTHDNAGQLTLRRSTDRAQDIVYGYDAAGQVTRIEDTDRNKVTSYVYDLAGRRVREKVVQNRTTYQDNFLSYDAQGRLRDVADARVHIAMDYDGVGNRTRISTRVNYQGVTKEVTDSSVRYFQYDEMNRQTVVDGIDEKGNIGAEQGHKVTYDKNGNRVQDVFYGNRVATTENVIEGYDEDGTVIYSAKSTTFKTTFGKSTETYRYDNLNRLMSVTRDGIQIDVRRYDGADRVIRSGPFAVHPDYAEALNKNVDPGEAHSQDVRINRYDDNGRLLHQRIQSSDGRKLKTDISWDPTERDDDHKDYVANGYDEAGNVRSYVVISHEGGGATEYKTKLARFEGYQTLTTTANASRRDDGLTTHEYDANGFLVGVKDATQNDNNRVFVNDSEGRVLAAKQEGHMRRQLIANGEVLGSYGVGVDPLEPFSGRNNTPNFADFADFNFGYARISAGYPSASPGAYQVQTGDSLQGIAQSAYGDSSLWYRIAEANGLSSSTDLRVGQTITIPNRVGTISNNSTTFKPYDAGLMVGDTTPNMPAPSGGGGGGCGGVGQLVMAIVAVVATVFTAGLLAPVVAGAAGGVGFGATMSAGIAGLSSGSIGFVGGAVAAGVGSVASQLVGLATGSIEQLSWKGVALSAVSGGFSSGMASLANGGSLLAEPIVRGAVVNAASQGIGVVTGLQQRFSWRGVAASAVGAGIGQAVGPAFGGAFGSTAAGEFGARLAMGLVAGTAAAVMRGGKVAIQQVAVDAFGNALGQSILDKATFEDPLGALVKEEVAGQDRADRYALSTGSNPIGLHTGGGSGFKTTQQGYANWSASINERVQSAALRSEVEFMPELHADGTRPVYDFGDPFAGGGDVVAANGAAVQMRAGNGVTVGGPGLQLGERISNGLQARGFKKNADADAYDRFMRTGMDLFGSKFVQQAIRAGDLPGGPGDLLIGLVGIGKAGQQAIRAADDASYLVERMFIGGAREAGPLRELEVGTYKELNSIRRTFGTAGTYDVDHIPSKAALRIAREDELGRSLTAAEVRQIESEGIGVVIGRDMHRDSRTYAGRNNALKIDDAANLHQAVRNDLNVFIGNAAARGLSEYQIMKTVAAAVMKNRQAGVMK